MELSTLTLHNFRNYTDLTLDFDQGVNVFLGQNAQGKTNLLESIYALALTRSHRTSLDKELIQWDEKEAHISGRVKRRLGDVPLSLSFTNKGKTARLNHLEQGRLSLYVGQLNVILFAPEDLALVKGAPAIRRRFIDMEFGQMSPRYLYNATQYRRILKERNAYLKQLQLQQATDTVFLDVLTEQLIDVAAELLMQRHEFLTQLQTAAQPIHQTIAPHETLTLVYQSSIALADRDLDSIKADLATQFAKYRTREQQQGTTLIGPHRDDVQFLVNDKDVAVFGSQGQQRTTALAVKLAEIDLMYRQTGEYPVLLLDDVLSELDATRQTQLLYAIQDKVQTFITAPSLSDVARALIKAPKVFHVNAGEITVESDTATIAAERNEDV